MIEENSIPAHLPTSIIEIKVIEKDEEESYNRKACIECVNASYGLRANDPEKWKPDFVFTNNWISYLVEEKDRKIFNMTTFRLDWIVSRCAPEFQTDPTMKMAAHLFGYDRIIANHFHATMQVKSIRTLNSSQFNEYEASHHFFFFHEIESLWIRI